ncbi:hypothetical protein HPB52_008267 [Rhipicephalus sanguineus]|uniref:Uncharacterized protein n=1 Tax=Rhipicephalus sanguineus TaxID=34632 RepID=A0A9D4Q6B8_RHISA|nr:hypothetical protein HPB52_008267 [Rhipicephalus sanguineus]
MRHMAPLCLGKGRDAEFPPKTDLGPPRCASPADRPSTLKSAPAAQTPLHLPGLRPPFDSMGVVGPRSVARDSPYTRHAGGMFPPMRHRCENNARVWVVCVCAGGGASKVTRKIRHLIGWKRRPLCPKV